MRYCMQGKGECQEEREYSKSFGSEEGERGILPVMSGVGVLPPSSMYSGVVWCGVLCLCAFGACAIT